MDGKGRGGKVWCEGRVDVFLLEDRQLLDSISKDGSALVDGVKEPKKILAEVPFSCCHSCSKKSDGVGGGVVELFEIVEDEEVGSRCFEEVGS